MNEEEGTLIFSISTQFHVIYGVEYFLRIVNNDKDRNKSLESNDGVEHIVRISKNSSKKTRIKRESTEQINKDK